VTGGDDPLRDGGNLVWGLSWAKNHLRETLSEGSMVVDPGEAQVLEGGLAQILNEALQCCLSCHRAGLNFKKEIADLGARHRWKKGSAPSA
jgi:hypothetical protein